MSKSKSQICASVMCADALHLGRDISELESVGVDYLHFDIMDGHFVPNLMLPPELIPKVRSVTPLPFDIHLMVEQPERLIPTLDLRSGDLVSVHFESTPHCQRAIAAVKEKGASAALALNPATGIECVRELLCDIDAVLIMSVNPGYSGQKLIPQSLDKIKRLRAMLDGLGYNNIRIEVDGNCSFENIPLMLESGADMLVAGSSSLFSKELTLSQAAEKMRSLM